MNTGGVRRRLSLVLAVVVSAAAALVASAPAPACGCGIALESSVARERALIVHEEGREQLVMSFDLLATRRSSRRSSCRFPRARPSAACAIRSPTSRTRRGRASSSSSASSTTTATAPTGGAPEVDVIDRKTIGGFDVTRIAGASDPKALSRWLDRNGYEMPKGAAPILADYAEQGWSFVALRLADGGSGRLKPLSVAFDSKQPIYPMLLDKLARSPIEVDLWLLTSGRVQVDGLDDRYAGRCPSSSPAVPERLASLLDGPYLTRVGGTVEPRTIRADFVAVPAAADSPYRAAVERVEYVDKPAELARGQPAARARSGPCCCSWRSGSAMRSTARLTRYSAWRPRMTTKRSTRLRSSSDSGSAGLDEQRHRAAVARPRRRGLAERRRDPDERLRAGVRHDRALLLLGGLLGAQHRHRHEVEPVRDVGDRVEAAAVDEQRELALLEHRADPALGRAVEDRRARRRGERAGRPWRSTVHATLRGGVGGPAATAPGRASVGRLGPTKPRAPRVQPAATQRCARRSSSARATALSAQPAARS